MNAARPRYRSWLLAHLVLVCALTLALVALIVTTPASSGANIGAGLVALPLLALGLPWSLAILVDPYRLDGLSETTRFVIDVAPAFVNVMLHGVIVLLRGRRA